MSASLSHCFRILVGRCVIWNITSKCVTSRKVAAKPKPQIHGQLPADQLNPGSVFNHLGIDYTGPVMVKYGVRKPKFTKGYIATFVYMYLSTKVVHLELVSDLTTSAYIAILRRFIGRTEVHKTIWSDHGFNFVGSKGRAINFQYHTVLYFSKH